MRRSRLGALRSRTRKKGTDLFSRENKSVPFYGGDPMSRHILTCAAWVATLVLTAPALAHHSFAAEFDINQPIELKGEVSRMVFTNPHSRIFLKVMTESGEVQEWSIEGGAPNAL